jgi:UDP-N-acetylmuramoyl-L-alanyl-D-glutamate--2,6-diaminopimelate ligase
MQVHLKTPFGEVDLRSNLLGRPNLSNLLAAVAAGYGLGIGKDGIQRGVENCLPVPGRFEPVDSGQPFHVIVDYAHTDDALEKVLLTARDLNPTRVLLLFGCGGDRDRSKRPAMGEVASRLSDFCVITSDNPRNESPSAIIEDIESGFTGSQKYQVEIDRGQAIRTILQLAQPEDIVVLAGKGHETTQVLADRVIPFDDREMAKSILKEMGYSDGPVCR